MMVLSTYPCVAFEKKQLKQQNYRIEKKKNESYQEILIPSKMPSINRGEICVPSMAGSTVE